jgi:hypothetical protein
MKIISHVKDWYTRYERPISSVALVGGFVWNALFLKRVDLFLENFWVILHLLTVGVCIIFINYYENKKATRQSNKDYSKIHFWLITVMQFTFGGLLSTYLVFYFRSATLFVTWPFLILLVVAFMANERLKHHYNRVVFQISLFYLAIFSFTIFFVPIIVKEVSVDIFVLSGIASLILIQLFFSVLKRMAYERWESNKRILYSTIFGIFFLVNILYFFNLIPPIPLSLKDGGVYHNVSKVSSGVYTVSHEKEDWSDYFSFYKTLHLVPGSSLYAYSAIFSPGEFKTGIIHEWQIYDSVNKTWQTVSIVPLTAIGGREDGYRTYSRKDDIKSGKWRVNVETKSGQVIGRLLFNVVIVDELPMLITENKE